MTILTDFKKLRAEYIKRNIPIISQNTKEYIIEILNEHKPNSIIEIGSCTGYSGIIMSQKLQERNGSLIGFEVSFPRYQEGLNSIYKYGIKNFNMYNTNFLEAPLNQILKNSIDLAFIDAKKQDYLKYLLKIIPHLHKESIVILDDVIEFKQKMLNLYNRLDKKQIPYKTIKLDSNDGIMQINLNKSILEQFNKAKTKN